MQSKAQNATKDTIGSQRKVAKTTTLKRSKAYTYIEYPQVKMDVDIDECEEDDQEDEWLGKKPMTVSQINLPIGKAPIRNNSQNSNLYQALSQCVGSLVEFYPQKSRGELAVHNKKIEEVAKWLVKTQQITKGAKTLLLTGPCGAGKTATLKVLCKEFEIEVLEYSPSRSYEMSWSTEEVWDVSEVKVFRSFIHDAEFCSLERHTKSRLVLIEHLPNRFYSEPYLFHDILRDYAHCSRSMIAIVMSNMGNRWDFSPERILPDHLLRELCIEHIKFNSIASTFMQKAIKRILDNMNLNISQKLIHELAKAADGDIRLAINALEFAITQNQFNPALVPSSTNVDLFHFIGKILYSKRAEIESEKWTKCERRLKRELSNRWSRPYPPKDDVYKLLESANISGSKLAEFVFEHEPNFTCSLGTISKIFSDLCDFDHALNSIELQTCAYLDSYLLQIVTRSTMFYNYDTRPTIRALYKFEKPKLQSLRTMQKETKLKAAVEFPNQRSREICYLTLPMISWLKTPLNNSQMELLRQFALNERRFLRLTLKRPRTSESNIQTQKILSAIESSPPVLDDGYNYDIEEDEDSDY